MMMHVECIANREIKFKMTMLTPLLCNKADPYIPVKGTITVTNTGTTGAPTTEKEYYLKILLQFQIALHK